MENNSMDPVPSDLGVGSRQVLQDLLISGLKTGSNLSSCYTCGICSAGCPASGLSGMDPGKFVRMICLGNDTHIMTNDWMWMCTICHRCVHACPMNIDIPLLVMALRSHRPMDKKPQALVKGCKIALKSDTCSFVDISMEDWKFIVEDVTDEVRQTQKGFEELNVPMDKKGAELFLNQNSNLPLTEPGEMAPLWKILHLAGADWTYGSKGWAAENFGFLLGDNQAWEKIIRKKVAVIEQLGCKVLLNTECGHEFLAVSQGLEKFNISHSFEIKSIIEYYAKWIRTGRLKVNSEWNHDLKIKFTLQDPCQLVRKTYGDFIADELRFVVREAVGEENFIDMIPNRSNNYCCGGGGGAIMSDFNKERLSYGKVKLEQIIETEAAYCITPCNSCHAQIMELGRYYDEKRFSTIHLWTILCLSMGVLGVNERKYLGRDLVSTLLAGDQQ